MSVWLTVAGAAAGVLIVVALAAADTLIFTHNSEDRSTQ